MYYDFIERDVIGPLGPNEPKRTIMHDNLSSHLQGATYDMVRRHGHQMIARVPYSPSDAPIEFAFNQLGNQLRLCSDRITNLQELIHEIPIIIANMTGFDACFAHCGYQ